MDDAASDLGPEVRLSRYTSESILAQVGSRVGYTHAVICAFVTPWVCTTSGQRIGDRTNLCAHYSGLDLELDMCCGILVAAGYGSAEKRPLIAQLEKCAMLVY